MEKIYEEMMETIRCFNKKYRINKACQCLYETGLVTIKRSDFGAFAVEATRQRMYINVSAMDVDTITVVI